MKKVLVVVGIIISAVIISGIIVGLGKNEKTLFNPAYIFHCLMKKLKLIIMF